MHRLAQTSRLAGHRHETETTNQTCHAADVVIQSAAVNQRGTQQRQDDSTRLAQFLQFLFCGTDFADQLPLGCIGRV